MLSVHEFLRRPKGQLGLLWLAGTSPTLVTDEQLEDVSLADLSDELQREMTQEIGGRKSLRFSLGLSCKLTKGLSVLHRRKAALVLDQGLQMITSRRQLKTRNLEWRSAKPELAKDAAERPRRRRARAPVCVACGVQCLPPTKRMKGATSRVDVPDDFDNPIAAPHPGENFLLVSCWELLVCTGF
ncbi:uncharacterized protein LOC125943837 [Dermacentor silvarum]|uniref:uncharacterized protein LOC125943837 n=1 Tax=Dermacentor silvarum TaxID=543639 RepID=UPI0021011865|nr:uncharacterized protein LOC125943837 [Dermacentor silvarum]